MRSTMARPNEGDPLHDASNVMAPSNAPNAAPKRAPPTMVPVATIEAWVAGFLRAKKSGGWPTIYCKRRDSSNIELLLAEGDDGGDAVGLGSKQVAKKMDGPGKRGYAGLLCAISFCLELRKSGKSATQRELYYLHKGGEDSPWRTQGECNESVADAATIFDCPRFALGITTSARGCCAGRLRGPWTSAFETTQMIQHDWMSDGAREVESDARCVVVVEKDGIFRRLVEDRFFERHPCVLVTGMGVPDIATRALVHKLRGSLDVPVYGLVDWNSWGVGVLLCYKVGSARLGLEAVRYTVDVKWIGLRSSQVDRLELPASCRQPLTARDRRRAEGLLAHPWVATKPAWQRELRRQLDLGSKCELEALFAGGDLDAVGAFIETAITTQDYLE
ncbi:ATP-hydrolyzing type II DNA topoisomerase [Aureococcus anophagefferens]|uniref:DNA topoisomerase (ATP-hydrolyzing) n=1 Tax=Aureococcus anophagefferens TaxID=44056 RepID=A0ABR1GEN1_AURAN